MESDTGSDQLRELFNACDLTGSGFLDHSGLLDLCRLLQLGDNEQNSLTSLIKDKSANPKQVNFLEFKTSFIEYLTQPNHTQTSVTSTADTSDAAVTPSTLIENLSEIGEDNDTSRLSTHSVTTDEAVSPTKRQRCRSGSTRPTHLSTKLFKDHNDSKANTSVDIDKYYWDIWLSLDIGRTGYLSRDELAVFCSHSWKSQPQADVDTLFTELDQDCDGRVSFQEFIRGLYAHKYPENKGSPPNKKLRKSLPSPNDEGAVDLDVEDGDEDGDALQQSLFSSISHDSSGLASPDKVISLWDELDIGNTTGVLMNLGFDPKSKVNLQELSHRLDEEVSKAVANSSSVALHAAVATYQHELQHLRSLIDHLLNERSKLRKDLTDSTTRNNLLLHEVDEQQDAIQKNAELNIKLIREGYEKEMKHLQEELESERAEFSQQLVLQEEYNTQPGDRSLRERLTGSHKEVERLQELLEQERDKTALLERTVARLDGKLKECEQARNELSTVLSNTTAVSQSESDKELLRDFESQNKKLKDEIDEKSAELEELRHKLVLMMRHRDTLDDRGSPLLRYLPTQRKTPQFGADVTDLMKYADETSYDFDGSFDIDPMHQSPTEDPIDYFCMYEEESLDRQLLHHQRLHGNHRDSAEFDIDDDDLLPLHLLASHDRINSPVSDQHDQSPGERSMAEVSELKDEMVRVRLVLAETQQRNVELIDELGETRASLDEKRRAEESLINKARLMDQYVSELQAQVEASKQKIADYDAVIRGFYTENAKIQADLAKCDKERSKAVVEATKLANQNSSLKKVIQRLRETAMKSSSGQENDFSDSCKS